MEWGSRKQEAGSRKQEAWNGEAEAKQVHACVASSVQCACEVAACSKQCVVAACSKQCSGSVWSRRQRALARLDLDGPAAVGRVEHHLCDAEGEARAVGNQNKVVIRADGVDEPAAMEGRGRKSSKRKR